MDSNNKQGSSHPRQSNSKKKPSSHRNNSRDGNKSRGSNKSRDKNKSKDKNRNANQNGGSNDKRYQQRSGYRNYRHHPTTGYNPELYEYNRNNNYNPKRSYNLQWNRNSIPNRNERWNNSGARFHSNHTWQRNSLNHVSHNFVQQLQPSEICNTSIGPEGESEETFYTDPTVDFENQNFVNSLQKPLNRFDYPSEPEDETAREDIQETKNQDEFEHHSELANESPKEVEPPQQTIDSLREKTTPHLDFFENQRTFDELSEQTPKQVDLETPNQEATFIKSEPDLCIFDIKSELPEPPDIDFELVNCLNVDTDNHFPSISVIPISRLIKSELQDLNRVDIIAPTSSEFLDLNRTDIIAPTTPARKRTLKPNLVQRRKKSFNDDNSGTLSENLVQRVANMDKIGIKNVINNSGTKYDAALKIQARKKLREEIRKQLKSMNFTPPENSENSVLVPDEIVDSMNIPAVVLDEIRKAFGIVLVEDMKVISEPEKADPPAPAPVTDKVAQPSEGPSKSPDLMSRLKMLEETKSQAEKVSEVNSKKRHSKSKPSEEVVVIDSSSSSSSSSSSDSDSDSSSTSTDSNTSTTSSFKRRRRKKRILEANVVGNFEKLILPNLTTAQRRRYKEKYSKTTKASLLYIYGVCVSRANSNTVDPKEKLKLKRNLSSADNAQALEFLMKAILNLFEHHKEKRRKEKSTPSAASPSKVVSRSKRSNLVSPTKKLNDSTCNQGYADDEHGGEQSESANSATRTCELPKHQSTKVDEASSPPPSEDGVNRNDGDSIKESANSAQGVRLVAQDSDSDSDSDNLTTNGNPPSRLWKSPGEKKCIEIEIPSPLSGLGMMQPPLGIQFDLDSLKSQSAIGDEAVSSIREIDVKLMELHKRKMYIEEMILKLQKDKMEVDLWTMKLQNEKFILLNSALANVSSSNTTLVAPKLEKTVNPKAKRKAFSTPFSEKLRNRKKRCQRDILLEDADNVINGNKPSGEVSDIFNLMQQPRRTRRDTRSSKNETEQTSTTDGINTDVGPKPEETVAEKENVDFTPITNVEVQQVDYTGVPNGNLEGWKLPITQIIVVGEAIIAASEDGNIYKFNIRTRELESKFSKHTEAITQIFTCPRENFVYTTSLDGFLKKTSIENFGLEIQSLNLQEPLQSIDIQWGTAFIGSRWGNIFTYDIKNNNLSESLLCSSGSSIIAIKATKEGPRKILIVSSKGNQIHFRDATTGLLLRLLDVPDNLHIYSILLDDGCIFCGTQRNEIHQYNFTTGGRLAIFQCGNGAVSMKLYKEKYIFVGCYDGFVYVLDKTTGCQIGRFPGSGKMILALEIAGDKLITSAKDNTMQIIDIPKYIVTKDKS